jgi:PAS domain S-box-containing protein
MQTLKWLRVTESGGMILTVACLLLVLLHNQTMNRNIILSVILLITLLGLKVLVFLMTRKVEDEVLEKNHWYEQIIDLWNNPLSITDMDMNWTFINKTVEGMIGKKRSEVIGQQCSNWGSSICNTEDCGVNCLRSGRRKTFFYQWEADFRVDTHFLLNRKGEKIGHLEIVTNISTQKQLLSSKQRNVLHVEKTPLAVIEWNSAFEVMEWNPMAEKIFGYSKKEAMGRHPVNLIVRENLRTKIVETWERLLDQKGGTRSTNENQTKKGETIYCEWYNTPLFDKNGKIVRVTSLAQNITERIIAEKELRLTKYSIDNSSNAAFWIKQNGHIRYANKTTSLLTGYSYQELMVSYVWDLDLSFSPVTFNTDWQELEKKGRHTFESNCTNKNGRQIPVEVTTNLHDFEGEKYIFAYMLDITERIKSEMERTQLVSVIEQSSDNIVITDLKGDIEYVNPAFERNTGYSRGEVHGKNPRILKSGKYNDDFYRNLWETITRGEIWTGKIINKRKDEKLIEEFATIFPVLASSGEIKNYVAVKRDMTEQNKLENQLNQAQKMEAIGTLAGGIAHDFNNILSAIFGFTQISKRKLSDSPENKKVDGYLDNIFSAGLRAKELINQILMFSRKGNFDPKNTNLQPLVTESVKFLRATIPTTISINQHIDPDLKNIYGDTTQIHQVIMNLCTNASHAMEDEGGTLEIALTNYHIKLKALETGNLEPGNYILLTVSDTGKGMNDEIKHRIFEPFFSTKEKTKGTGLGLSVVHGIISKHGGAINVYSQEGLGTKFNIYLPAGTDDTSETEKEDELDLPTGSESILFVDDERELCTAYGEMLKFQGYQVQTTSSSQNALDRIIKNPDKYDLVITDYTMPEMNGIELCREIRKYNKHVPIILISGLGELILDEEMKSAGVTAKHSKPIEFGTLIRGVRNILDNK